MKRLSLIFLTISILVDAQEKMTLDAVQDSLSKLLALYPQEKIHLHTDRTRYVPGEKIWFKAYLVDAFTHQSPTLSNYVYVELINSADSLVHRVMVSYDNKIEDNGRMPLILYRDDNINGKGRMKLLHGHLFLSDVIPEGEYTIRAYTRYMENLGDDYFFKKNIRIENLKAEAKPVKRQPRADYDVSFFPEGGYLTEGVVSRVSFKALNRQGASENITGEVVDKTGTLIAEVKTVFAGMGSFSFIPQEGNDYFLLCKNGLGQEKRFKLPLARKTCSVKTSSLNKRHLIQVIHSPELPETLHYLLVHCKGEVFYFSEWNPRSEGISFSNEQLPSGVVQVLLLDEQMNPVSERLIFNRNNDQAQLVFSSDKPYYQKREKITAEIHVTDSEGNPLAGHVSVAVTDDRDIAIDALNTITSSLLLSSELKGVIESPGYYLQDHQEAKVALDLLMMTHGWRRYEIAEAIKGNHSLPEKSFEVLKEIAGSVKSLWLGKPVVNGEVQIFAKTGGFDQTVTDNTGTFRFFLHYPDSAQFIVQAKTQKGKTGIALVINDELFPKPKYAPNLSPSTLASKRNEYQPTDSAYNFIEKAEQRSKYDEDMKIVNLSEVTVTARMVDKKDEVRRTNWATGGDFVIYREDIEKKNPVRVSDLLLMYDAAIGPGGTLFIDGIPANILLIGINDLNVLDIERIDIFHRNRGGRAMFGLKGVYGVISITTRLGNNKPELPDPNYKTIAPFGYQQPVEFYAPKYDTPELRNRSMPDYRTTIYWKPDIITTDDGKASFDFYSADFSTTYSVVIEGLTFTGQIIRQVETIDVR